MMLAPLLNRAFSIIAMLQITALASLLINNEGEDMITITTDYKHDSITEQYPTLEDAMAAYADADYAACHQPGNDIRRITLRVNGSTIKVKTY